MSKKIKCKYGKVLYDEECYNCNELFDDIKEESDCMSEEWEEVKSSMNMWLPEKVGDILIGTILEKRDGSYGPQWLIKLETGEELWTPSHKVLQNRMNMIMLGSTVKIEKAEDLPPKVRGQNPTSMYKVSIKKAYNKKP